jgi:hypothetical protein
MIRDGEKIVATPCWGERPSIAEWSDAAAPAVAHVAAAEAAGCVVEVSDLDYACAAISLARRIGRAEEMTEAEALDLVGTTPTEAKRLRRWRDRLRAKTQS